MVNGIGRSHKPGEQTRQKPGVTNEPLNTALPTLHSYYKSNENIDISSK